MSSITIHMVRGDSETGADTVTYTAPFIEGMSLLDAVLWLREHVDASIAVRYSCRSANACKECSAFIDEKPGYLCSTRAVAGSEVHLAPLKGREWVRDLTTFME